MENLNCDVLIIGGGPAAGVAALSAKANHPDKKIVMMKESDVALVPCAIPYIFGKTLGSSEKNLGSCAPIINSGVEVITGRVEKVEIERKTAYTPELAVTFEKLIFATGSVPFVHAALDVGDDVKGVFTIAKSKEKIDELVAYAGTREKIVVVGTGFIGIEIGLELAEVGKEVTIIGGTEQVLKDAFDKELAEKAEALIAGAGVTLQLNDYVDTIVQENGVAVGVKLCSGKVILCDVVILATGYKANTDLAKEAGLKLARYGGIWVDEYMRTRNKDIFAVGDCAARRDFITRDPSKIMLASTSSAEGRIAGSSLYKLKYLKGIDGTIAIFSTMIAGTAFSSAGVTEHEARKQGFDVVTGSFEGINRHPGTIPGATKQSVKLIAMKHSGRVIGGQIIGGPEAGEMINVIGLIIEARLTIYSLLSLQIATHPLLTAAPTAYPITKAAEIISHKIGE